jgi:hypothetical protein
MVYLGDTLLPTGDRAMADISSRGHWVECTAENGVKFSVNLNNAFIVEDEIGGSKLTKILPLGGGLPVYVKETRQQLVSQNPRE